MNSDPNESAAWRVFGMLDADEAAGFDEAMRHNPELRNAHREMDCLAAAVAVAVTRPIAPRAGQLERLHERLGLNVVKPRNWLAISGWAAAAVLAMALLVDHQPSRGAVVMNPGVPEPVVSRDRTASRPAAETDSLAPEEIGVGNPLPADEPSDLPESTGKAVARVETRRLIQEIEVLREKLESFQERDRKRFETVDGLAWPVVMRMRPPGAVEEIRDGLALRKEDLPPLTAILGDALAFGRSGDATMSAFGAAPVPPEPSAIPIYDPARDAGTIVINGILPAKAAGESYKLWVMTEQGGSPIYVGTLPESNAQGADIFDFSLGSKTTVPSSFVLTKGPQGQPEAPSKKNIVLEGPR